jgi:xanthine dehydrogenase molybdopterin-binding subunit B
MVYNVTLEKGFVERGRITHVSAEEELKRGYYYGSDSVVRRSLFMDDYLYTFSDKMLKSNNLSTLAPISEVLFPLTNPVQSGPTPLID